jgi:hypothetical protein
MIFSFVNEFSGKIPAINFFYGIKLIKKEIKQQEHSKERNYIFVI